MSYLLISPCRNEADFLKKTLDSVAAQTVLPAKWVIVDDGSTDDTPKILEEYRQRHDWIQIIRNTNRGTRSVGPGVVQAFYKGLDTVALSDFDYLCKLDMDLILPETYFAELMRRMAENPRIGCCSGKAYYIKDGREVSEGIGDEMCVGASKFYRRECFEEIGGFVREVMWDAIDCHKCRQLGWIACSWDDPKIRFIHLRPMGSSHKGIFTGRVRHGYGQYFMGTHPIYLLATAVYRLARPPYVIGGIAVAYGFFRSLLRRDRTYPDAALKKFIRRYQMSALFRGKKATVRDIDHEGESVWRERRNGGR